MRLRQLFEDGRIVKGVNTTVDVGPDEIRTQAAKFGFKVDKDGHPPTLSKKVKGKSTNVLYNLGLAESKSYKCPRTKAESCQCESVNKITESDDAVTAVCVLEHSDTVKGTILFKQIPGQPTLIVGEITGMEPGEHGFHIHEFGDLSKGCESAGGHYNPDGVDHGDLEQGHVGDLGNITADDSGTASIKIVAKRIDLTGERSIVGRSVVVHADVDDLGKGGDDESLKTGNAGDRLACGVILLKETVKENLDEGYKLQLERDKELLVLHIKDTATGKRTEVRGKPGYETDYDPNDKLHMLLDKVGKSANISELMNGEVVSINPKHPDADRAKAATNKAYNEKWSAKYKKSIDCSNPKGFSQKAHCAGRKKK